MFNKVNDKKILHKIGKHWGTISIAMLAMIGGGAAVSTGAVSHIADVAPAAVAAHADTENVSASDVNNVSVTLPNGATGANSAEVNFSAGNSSFSASSMSSSAIDNTLKANGISYSLISNSNDKYSASVNDTLVSKGSNSEVFGDPNVLLSVNSGSNVSIAKNTASISDTDVARNPFTVSYTGENHYAISANDTEDNTKINGGSTVTSFSAGNAGNYSSGDVISNVSAANQSVSSDGMTYNLSNVVATGNVNVDNIGFVTTGQNSLTAFYSPKAAESGSVDNASIKFMDGNNLIANAPSNNVGYTLNKDLSGNHTYNVNNKGQIIDGDAAVGALNNLQLLSFTANNSAYTLNDNGSRAITSNNGKGISALTLKYTKTPITYLILTPKTVNANGTPVDTGMNFDLHAPFMANKQYDVNTDGSFYRDDDTNKVTLGKLIPQGTLTVGNNNYTFKDFNGSFTIGSDPADAYVATNNVELNYAPNNNTYKANLTYVNDANHSQTLGKGSLTANNLTSAPSVKASDLDTIPNDNLPQGTTVASDSANQVIDFGSVNGEPASNVVYVSYKPAKPGYKANLIYKDVNNNDNIVGRGSFDIIDLDSKPSINTNNLPLINGAGFPSSYTVDKSSVNQNINLSDYNANATNDVVYVTKNNQQNSDQQAANSFLDLVNILTKLGII